HSRTKHRGRCGGGGLTAPGPAKLVAGGRYAVDFAVSVAVAKYVDHLPLARRVRQMARAGLTVDTQTLWDQLLALSHHLTPTYEALCADVRTAAGLGADETTWQLMEPGRSKPWWVRAPCRAEPSSPQAAEALALIGDLYAAEGAAQETAAGDAGVLLVERRTRVAPVVDAIRTWVTQQRALPQSALGKALAYTTELWPGLVAF